jgi:hypothetical protein
VRWVFCTKLRLAIDVLQDRVTGGRTPGTVSLRGLAFVLPHLTSGLRRQRSRDKGVPVCVSSAHETSERGWPNFEQNCQFDFINPSNEARIVRVIAIK